MRRTWGEAEFLLKLGDGRLPSAFGGVTLAL